MALPRDNCLYAGDPNNPCTELNGTPMEGKIGDGLWNFQAYWDTNFHTGGVYPNSWSNDPAHLPSRHEVYRYEVDNGLIPTRSLGNPSGTPPHLGEDGTPECYGGGAGTISDDPDRRLLYGAVINCIEYEDEMNGASGGPIPVETFASFFLTEPVQQGGPDDDVIRTELVDLSNHEGSSLANLERANVQLYR
jgi:hypothetical protein